MFLEYKKNYYSQNGEDGIIEKIIEDLSLKTKLYLCEFGAWDGKYFSNTFNLVEKKGAIALMIECDKQKFQKLLSTSEKYKNIIPINRFVLPFGDNSIDRILKENNFPKDFDLLSIDVDSNDLEIWENQKEFTPKIVIIEINSYIKPGVRQRHDPIKNIKGNSFQSTLDVAKKKGYVLISHTGNLIFLRSDLANKLKIKPKFLNFPEKLFVYDWILKKRIFENSIVNFLKPLFPNKIGILIRETFKRIFFKVLK